MEKIGFLIKQPTRVNMPLSNNQWPIGMYWTTTESRDQKLNHWIQLNYRKMSIFFCFWFVIQVQSWLQASNNTGIFNTCTRLWLTESEQATPVDSIKDVFRSFVKVPEFEKRLKKAGGHIGRNVVEIVIKMETIVRKPLMIKIILLIKYSDQIQTTHQQLYGFKLLIMIISRKQLNSSIRPIDGTITGTNTIGQSEPLLFTMLCLVWHIGYLQQCFANFWS